MRKSIRNRLLATTVGVAVLGAAFAANATTTLRWSDGQPNRGVNSELLKWFASEVDKRSKGDLKFRIHWGGALFKSKAAIQGVGTRAADMATIISAYTPKELAAYSIGDIPLPNSDIWVGMRAMYELSTTHPALKKMFSDLNLAYVTNLSTSSINILCKDKFIKKMSDLDGVSIRAVGPYGRVFKDLGASVVRMSQANVYKALDSGIVTCNQNYLYSIEVFKQNDVAKYLTRLDWGQHLGFGIVMNKQTHAELTDSQREVLHEVGSEFIDRFSRRIQEANEKALERMTSGSSPLKVEDMEPAEKAKLLEKGMEAARAWVARADAAGLPGQDIYDTYLGLVAKYEKIRDEKGYPWTR